MYVILQNRTERTKCFRLKEKYAYVHLELTSNLNSQLHRALFCVKQGEN